MSKLRLPRRTEASPSEPLALAQAGSQTPRALRPYQQKALPYLRKQTHPAFLWEMRLGKTVMAIRTLRGYLSPNRSRFLIVAPSSALLSWMEELAREGVPETEIALLQGPRKRRLALLGEGRRWNLINREGWRGLPEIGTEPWLAVVVDESTCLKNVRAKITRFFLSNFRDVPHRWIMTGTINPESDMDIWAQLAFLDGQAFGHRSYWSWLTKAWKRDPTGYGWIPRLGTQSAIRQELGARAYILRRKDVGLGGEKVYERRTVEFPATLRKQYKQIEAEFALPGVSPAGAPLAETKFAGARYHWMRELCGGFLGVKLVWPGKLNVLVEILTGELARDPVVVWFYYNAELNAAKEALNKAGVRWVALWGDLSPEQRRTNNRIFQLGRARVILAQQAVAQMGSNFSRADTAIYYSTPLGALARQQTEDRIVDVSRKSPHLIIDLVVPNSVDQDAVDMVREKGAAGAWTLGRARALALARRQRG